MRALRRLWINIRIDFLVWVGRYARKAQRARGLSFQPSRPACFSTSLEDLAGKNLSDNTSLEDVDEKSSCNNHVLILSD